MVELTLVFQPVTSCSMIMEQSPPNSQSCSTLHCFFPCYSLCFLSPTLKLRTLAKSYECNDHCLQGTQQFLLIASDTCSQNQILATFLSSPGLAGSRFQGPIKKHESPVLWGLGGLCGMTLKVNSGAYLGRWDGG